MCVGRGAKARGLLRHDAHCDEEEEDETDRERDFVKGAAEAKREYPAAVRNRARVGRTECCQG